MKTTLLLFLLVCFCGYSAKADMYDIIGSNEYNFETGIPMCGFQTASDYNQLITREEIMGAIMNQSVATCNVPLQGVVNSLALRFFFDDWEKDMYPEYLPAILEQMEHSSTNITIWAANVSWENLPKQQYNVNAPNNNIEYKQIYHRDRWNWAKARAEDPYEKDNPIKYYGNEEWATLPFDTPFVYTGGAILIKICCEAAEKPNDRWNRREYSARLMCYGRPYNYRTETPNISSNNALNAHSDMDYNYSSTKMLGCANVPTDSSWYDFRDEYWNPCPEGDLSCGMWLYTAFDYRCEDTVDFNWGAGMSCGMEWIDYQQNAAEFNALKAGGTPKKLIHRADSYRYRYDFRLDFTLLPNLVTTYPAKENVFVSTTNASASTYPNIVAPYLQYCYTKAQFPNNVTVSYRVLNSRGNEVFRAIDPITGSEWVSIDQSKLISGQDGTYTYYFAKAIGSLADASLPDRAQISFKSDNLAGDYTVEVVTRFLDESSGEYITEERTSNIIVRYPDNIALTLIALPVEDQIYRISDEPIPFQVNYINTGLQSLPAFGINYTVSHVITTVVGNNEVQSYRPIYDTTCYFTSNPLLAGQNGVQDLSSFIPNGIAALEAGDYVLDVKIFTGTDSTTGLGNSLRQPFRLNYAYDGSVDSVLFPNNETELYTHQAYYPQVRVSNRAAMVANSVELTVTCQSVSSSNIVYQSRETVLGLPAWAEYEDEDGNVVPVESVFRDITLTHPMILREPGVYRLTISIDSAEDRNLLNNVLSYNFTIEPSLSGTYYVGTEMDYPGLSVAFTDVYTRGIDDSVRFVMSAGPHRFGSATSEYGLELSSGIGGIDSTNSGTISIVSEPTAARGSVLLEFQSRSGVGLYVASASASPYPNAPVNQFSGTELAPVGERKKDYDRFNARLVIDGGPNKSLRIRMLDGLGRALGSGNNVPILLGRGVQNVIIRNCIIETDAVAGARVPGVLYDTRFNSFTFKDLESVSAGILIRNELPVDRFGRNDFGIDTVLNSNILIEDCEFIGGSYGVISTGIGPLYSHPTSSYVGYYNMNNVIRDNIFVGQTVAGVFMGYEQGSEVSGNVISGVGSSSYAGDVAGIILGGMGDPAVASAGGTTGYNNFNVTLNGNDINGVSANIGSAYGIKVEQTMNDFSYSHLIGNKYFTNHNDSLNIYNNAIWNINGSGDIYGVRMFGSRDTISADSKFDRFTARLSSRLYISHARVANNTIHLTPSSYSSSSYLGGVVLQDVDTLEFYNNAVSVAAPVGVGVSDIFAPLVVQSVNPIYGQTSFLMDNNIYYSSPDSENIIRFIEQDDIEPGKLLADGSGGRYRGMDQWRRLSGAEDLSSVADFSDMLATKSESVPLEGTAGYSYSRYVLSDLLGTVSGISLNNRGRRLPYVSVDITGSSRGYATRLYDIGAWEFNGTQYDDDCEVLGFAAPLNLRSTVRPFEDAEYVMAPSAIEIAVRVRNNGTSSVQQRSLNLLVERQQPNGLYIKVTDLQKKFSLSTGETVVVDFSDQIAGLTGSAVFPRTYADLGVALGAGEARFYWMRNNVTPIYRYTAYLDDEGDRNSGNDTNMTDKVVRYYLKKSEVSLLLSVENTTFVPSGSAANYVTWLTENRDDLESVHGTQKVLDSVSSYLNYRNLLAGFSDLGFNNDSLGYDLFDRNVWEPSSVNYVPYRYMFWSDGHDARLTSNQIRDLNLFMHNGRNLRKSIVMASEELARNTTQSVVSAPLRPDLIKTIFGTTIKDGGFYSLNPANSLRLNGNALAPNLSLFLTQTSLYTDYNLDNAYLPSLFASYGSNPSLSSRQALYYADPAGTASIDKTFGLVSFSPEQHCIYLGADWRNFSDVSLLLESILSSMGGLLSDDASLPVELISFDASALNGSVLVSWSTSSESSSREYIVEKLAGAAFEPIYHTLANNSHHLMNNYSAVDAAVSAGNTYTYRLRTLLSDGSISYSSECSVHLLGSGLALSLGVPTPSPASSILTLNYSLSLPSSVRLSIYDMSGAEVLVLRSGGVLAGGSYSESYSVGDLAAGSYNLVLECGGVVKMQRFVVSR